jgi:hypothetical protein
MSRAPTATKNALTSAVDACIAALEDLICYRWDGDDDDDACAVPYGISPGASVSKVDWDEAARADPATAIATVTRSVPLKVVHQTLLACASMVGCWRMDGALCVQHKASEMYLLLQTGVERRTQVPVLCPKGPQVNAGWPQHWLSTDPGPLDEHRAEVRKQVRAAVAAQAWALAV